MDAAYSSIFARLAEIGLCQDFELSCHRDDGVETELMDHTCYDGVSGLLATLRGAYPGAVISTRVPRRVEPPEWQKWKAWWRISRAPEVEPHLNDWWRKQVPSVTVIQFIQGDELERVKVEAKNNGASLSAWLLARVHQGVLKQVKESVQRDEYVWTVPVSLAENPLTNEGICSASLELSLSHRADVLEVQQTLLQALERDDVWGMWAMRKVHAWLLKNGSQKQLRKHFEQNARFGSFSNLGVWEVDEMPTGERWSFAGPVSQVQPINCGVVTVNGVLAVTLRAHKKLGMDEVAVREVLEAIAR